MDQRPDNFKHPWPVCPCALGLMPSCSWCKRLFASPLVDFDALVYRGVGNRADHQSERTAPMNMSFRLGQKDTRKCQKEAI